MSAASRKILCVDDQIEIIDLLRRHLEPDLDCVFATSPEEALVTLQADGPFAIVIADYGMPEMNGVELLREVRTRAPQTVAMMLTAHSEVDVAVDALHQGGIFRFLHKPWTRETIHKAIADGLEQHRIIVNERNLRRELADANAKLAAKLEQVEELNQLLEYWVEFSPAVIYSLALGEERPKATYVSKNFTRLVGYDRTELILNPQFWSDLLHPEDAPRVQDTLRRLIDEGGENASLEYRIRHRDGAWRTVCDSMRVIRNTAGEPLELVGAWMDVSTRPD